MSNTTKYILIGGGVALAVYLVAKKFAPPQEQKSPVAQLFDSAKGMVEAVKTLARPAPGGTELADNTLPYGPTASDGTAAISDAMGVRQLRALIPAQTAYLTQSQEALVGLS